MFVKICGITRPADGLAAADAGADAIGLNFVSSSHRCIDVETARAILTVVPDGVMAVGVFAQEESDILGTTAALDLDAAQLHGDVPAEVRAEVARAVPTVIDVVAVDGGAVRATERGADILMLDAPTSGAGVPFDWGLVGDLATTERILLAGGLRPDNVAEAIRRVRPWGVDVATGVEHEPGRKDPAAIARFVAEARAAGLVSDAAAPSPSVRHP